MNAIKKILIVDDNREAADTMSKLLTISGYMTNVVYSGGEAISIVKTFAPDCILLDIGLPDMNGCDVARRIREHNQTVVIVGLSGYGQDKDVAEALNAGFDHHLTKPARFVDLKHFLDSPRPVQR